MTTYDLLTAPQRSFLDRLLIERLDTLGFASYDEAHTALSLATISKSAASELIDRLLGIDKDVDPKAPPVVAQAARSGVNKRADRCLGCQHKVAAGAGYWLTWQGGFAVHHAVGDCPTTKAFVPTVDTAYATPAGLVLTYRTQRGNLAGKVLDRKGKWVWAGDALSRIDADTPVVPTDRLADAVCVERFGAPLGSPELAQRALEFAHAHSACIFCARELTDPASDPLQGGVGYGAVCANKYGLPHGNVRR